MYLFFAARPGWVGGCWMYQHYVTFKLSEFCGDKMKVSRADCCNFLLQGLILANQNSASCHTPLLQLYHWTENDDVTDLTSTTHGGSRTYMEGSDGTWHLPSQTILHLNYIGATDNLCLMFVYLHEKWLLATYMCIHRHWCTLSLPLCYLADNVYMRYWWKYYVHDMAWQYITVSWILMRRKTPPIHWK